MELQVGVKILLQNRKGDYLLIRRSPDKYPEVGPKWDIVGGRIHPGSTLLENLAREVKEETNLDLTQQVTLIAAQDILRLQNKHIVRLTYRGTIEGEPKLDDDHIEFKWFSMEEMKQLKESELDIYFKELLDIDVISSSLFASHDKKTV